MMRTSNHLGRRLSKHRRRRAIFLTAAAALSTTFSGSHAFSIQPAFQRTTPTRFPHGSPSPFIATPAVRTTQSRLYSSGNDNSGILGTLKKGVKKVLPSSWFQSEEEKKAALVRERTKNELKGGLKEMLKDAPLPVRMMGGLVAPLISNAMSGLAETMAEQQQAVEGVLNDSKTYLLSDPAVSQLLGDGPIQLGSPFSQSSSSSNINGQMTTRVQLAFPVQGSMQSGVAKATSANGSLEQLILQAGGRTINVSMSSKTPRTSSFRSSKSGGSDDIIEAEIIEKVDKP